MTAAAKMVIGVGLGMQAGTFIASGLWMAAVGAIIVLIGVHLTKGPTP
jgi:hypothetical protein